MRRGSMKELVNRFVQIRKDFLETVSSFPADRIEEPLCGEWDIKCVLAHMAGWDIYFGKIVNLLRIGKDTPYWGDIQACNEAAVREREGRTWDEVRDEFKKTGQEFIEAYSTLDEQLWSKRFWEQADLAPAGVLEINIHHYGEHLEEIEKKLSEWGG